MKLPSNPDDPSCDDIPAHHYLPTYIDYVLLYHNSRFYIMCEYIWWHISKYLQNFHVSQSLTVYEMSAHTMIELDQISMWLISQTFMSGNAAQFMCNLLYITSFYQNGVYITMLYLTWSGCLICLGLSLHPDTRSLVYWMSPLSRPSTLSRAMPPVWKLSQLVKLTHVSVMNWFIGLGPKHKSDSCWQ